VLIRSADRIKKAFRVKSVRLVESGRTSMHARQVDYYLTAGRNRKSVDDIIVDGAPQYDRPNRLDTHGFFENRLQIHELRQVVPCQFTLLSCVIDNCNSLDLV